MELDFTTDVIEKLLLKRALVDKNWLNTVSNIYDARWFRTPQMGIIVSLAVKFYKKYSKAPSVQRLQMHPPDAVAACSGQHAAKKHVQDRLLFLRLQSSRVYLRRQSRPLPFQPHQGSVQA